jgi:hypothetical protein
MTATSFLHLTARQIHKKTLYLSLKGDDVHAEALFTIVITLFFQ